MQERLELMKQGNILHPANLENHSVMLREERLREQSALAQIRTQEAREEDQEVIRQIQEQEQMEEQEAQQAQQAQLDYEAAEGGAPPMPEDPTQAGPAQERLQGGPEAQQIQQREFEANAPT